MKAIAALCATALLASCATTTAPATNQVRVTGGVVEGAAAEANGVRAFLGIPYAAPPVGENRWRAPQPVVAWEGVRQATAFGPRCIPTFDFPDMVFRADGASEDCLTLNVWTGAASADERRPVLVYFYGGGYITGSGDEPRYDGAALAERGIVVVTMNYRLGVFGFFAHPELTAEAPYRASGNYAFLDHKAALEWVRDNIEAFGGDPERVTVAGESAGSVSTSVVMTSPLTKDLINGAIGQSGSLLGTLPPVSLAMAEQAGAQFGTAIGAPNISALRAIPADQLVPRVLQQRAMSGPTLDGYVFPQAPSAIYAAGQQARVPLMAGITSAEGGPDGVLGSEAPTVANYRAALTRLYPTHADAVFAAYPAASDGEAVLDAAQALAGDRFIGQSTWNWINAATQTGGANTYYYYYDQPRPVFREGATNPYGANWQPPRGAAHSADIEYFLGNLDGNPLYAWTETDREVSDIMQRYLVNFISTGDPNGAGLPQWGTFASGQRLIIDANTRGVSDDSRARYEAMARLPATPQ